MIKYITLKTEDGLEVTFSNLGASIFEIRYNHRLMTLTPKRKKDFCREDIYHGKTIGPICGRIEKGQLFIIDKVYNYPINEGENCLHGGPHGYSNRIFDYELTKSGIRFSQEDELGKYIVEYHLNKNVLRVDFRVEPKEEIPLALTNHAYFSLGKKNILKNKLQIKASKYIEVNKADLLPLGIKKVPACLNFKKARTIGRCIDNPYLQNSHTKGYDHSLLLDEMFSPVILETKTYRMTITSDFNAIQIYSDNYDVNAEMKGTNEALHRGIAIEPQDNQLERKTYKDIYQRYIEYRFEKK